MRATGGRQRLLRYGVLPLGAMLVVAGCASMPSSGEVRKVGDGQRADADSQVRVFGVPPHPGESAPDIVSGFLEATTSGETDFSTAKKYLTKDAAAGWDPSARITVAANWDPPSESDGFPRKEGYSTVNLVGKAAAYVDAQHAYAPASGSDFQTSFTLVRVNKEWRIAGLRDGLVLSQSDFQRIYHSVNMYYFANLGPDSGGGAQQTLVADPVYLRNQNDQLVSTVAALLGGPTTWLAPVVSTAAPAGVRLYDRGPDHGVTLDDSQQLKVRLTGPTGELRGRRCEELAAQLFATVQAQASAKLAGAEVQRADGSTACTLPSSHATRYGPENLVGSTTRQYYIRSDSAHRLMQLVGDNTATSPVTAAPVPGPFGSDKADLSSVAVRRDEQVAAGVRAGGASLVVAPLVEGVSFGAPVVTSKAASPKDGLSAPSWDGFGDLWVADRDPADPRLLVLHNGMGTPIPVSVPGLKGRIESLRVASDGVRIALVVQQGGVTQLQLGRIERAGTRDAPAFSVTGLHALTPASENVTSVAWAGASRLVVLASETGGAQQIVYMSTDGSSGSALQGVSEAASVAATEDQDRPLLASYNGSVYLLPVDANWKQIRPGGGSPVYPG